MAQYNVHIICAKCGSTDVKFKFSQKTEDHCGTSMSCENCGTLTSCDEWNSNNDKESNDWMKV